MAYPCASLGRDSRFFLAALLVATLLAFALRLSVSPHRPVHTDEAVNALVLEGMLAGNPFRYDPDDKHGPTLLYATYPLVRALGITRLDQLEAWHLRLVPAFFGSVLLLVPALFAIELGGRLAALGSALWLGLGAPFVYYGADWIHETLFVFFTAFGLAAATRWTRTGRDRWALLAGVCAGLLLATKETALLTFAATLAGLGLVAVVNRPLIPIGLGRACALAVGAATLVVILAYSALGRHLEDLFKLLAAATRFTARAGGEGHEKPWLTYLAWLGTPNLRSLPWIGWTLLAAGCAFPFLDRRPLRARPLPVFLAGFTAASLLVYCAIPYKTPWLALNILTPAALLAGSSLAAFATRSRVVALGFSATIAALLLLETHRLCVRFAADPANPWAYAPTVPDAARLQSRIEAYAATRVENFATRVQVVGPDIWPLPWFLRRLPETRYASELPPELDAPVVIADLAASDAVAARLGEAYAPYLHGLRPDVLVTVFLRRAEAPVPSP